MRTSSLRIAILVAIIAPLAIFHPTMARAATVTVMVGSGGFYNSGFSFSPSSVTIHAGDSVIWTWSSSGHSSTSGAPGMPNGLWDSGIQNQGNTFSHTFSTAGSFPYYCTVHGACCGMTGTVVVSNPTPTPTPAAGERLGNISTRSLVETGNNVMIGGFVIAGSGTKTVIVRALGPELTPFGIPNALADPTLELHNGAGALIASNDNWPTTILGGVITGSQVSAIQKSGHGPTQPSEPAIMATLPPGNYTAIVRGANNTVGVALVEVDDLTPFRDDQ